jgi:hypothetical protein
MEFSLHERRRLALIEQELSSDRRLVAMLGILESTRRKPVRVLRYAGARVRRPGGRHSAPATLRYRLAMTSLVVASGLIVAAPGLLITGLLLDVPVLIVVAAAALPLPPLLLVLSRRWVRRLRRTQH